LRDVLKYDGLYPNINRVTVLQNNHDTDRFMSLPGATLEGAMLHTAFILATRGIPQLYYGEEIAMTGGHDPDNRKDFPGGWREDSVNKFTKESRTADEQKMFEWTQKWVKLRKGNVALQKGFITDLFYDNDAYIFSRSEYLLETQGIDSWQYIIVAFNNSDSKKEFSFNNFPSWFEIDSCFTPLPIKSFSRDFAVCFDSANEKYNFTLPPKSAQSFIAKRGPYFK